MASLLCPNLTNFSSFRATELPLMVASFGLDGNIALDLKVLELIARAPLAGLMHGFLSTSTAALFHIVHRGGVDSNVCGGV